MNRFLALFLSLFILLSQPALAAKTTFSDGNAATRTPGTKVTAAFLNSINNQRHDGQNIDGSGVLDYAVDSGTANAIAIALTPALTAHVEGLYIRLKVVAANTGATTIAVNSLTAVPLTKRGSTALVAQDLIAGQIIDISWDGTRYQIVGREAPQITDVTTVGGQTAAQLAPSGAIMAFGMPTAPSGWLPCDGRVISRTTYAPLFTAIGTNWGAGDNITTFKIPDLRGYFLRGWDNGAGVDTGRSFASTQADALAPHTHTVASHVDGSAQGGSRDQSIWTGTVPTGTVNTGSTGDTETRPKNIAIFYAIKL